jgi:hypothetical protein
VSKTPQTAAEFIALERKLAAAEIARKTAAQAAMLREDATALRIAKAFPGVAAAVNASLDAWVAERLAGIPNPSVSTLAYIERARRNAFNGEMVSAKRKLATFSKSSATRMACLKAPDPVIS